ncbi:MAG: hypothetical protein KF858_08140 [Candidatus Sumerlaeia bacterium]|nr:hypothetical protein [Candidatus Sumerlaeia bacterium]
MGIYAHSTHLFLPDKDHGRLLAGALFKSPHSLVLSTPYGNWINVYLQMGLSCKDIPQLPTTTHIELNCYNSEGLDVRLYARDRLAFLFESGCNELAEQEDQLMELAAQLWQLDPGRPIPEVPTRPESGDDLPAPSEPSFWDLTPAQQEEYLAQARRSGEFQEVLRRSTDSEDLVPDPEAFGPYLPADRTIDEFRVLLAATSRRLLGPPIMGSEVAALQRWMGTDHSTRAEDYVAAIASFLGVRGALWSLESIQEHRAEQINRRIIPIDQLDQPPPRT